MTAEIPTRNVNSVNQHGSDDIESLSDGLGRSGHVDDETSSSEPGNSSRKHAERDLPEGRCPHRFGDPRNLSVDHGPCSFRRQVTGTGPGTAGGNNERHLVCEARENACNRFDTVGNNHRFRNCEAEILERGGCKRTGGVYCRPCVHGVRNRDNCCSSVSHAANPLTSPRTLTGDAPFPPSQNGRSP